MVGPYIGSLNRKIKILQIVKERDSTGSEKSVRKVFCEPWSSIVSESGGKEIDMATMELSSRSYVIRWRKEIEEDGVKMILDDSGVLYRIDYISFIGRRRFLQLSCSNYEQ
ncbi:head-tail adaptor protein [Myroides marinus]|uniref:head-tail adaptor protein n=1 Tax=Myroides marinus TaxID=703342 RepID=UPI002577E098|nr:head-tail adaptor protein [Myroides marinus]MDM1378816.1 head-tail adaptor protein [Myroides marinus]MDM1386087.1 head-tail adaptor protein [Myroides marinus]MDM1393300.1 head-tail adaptor protein [Myroides marinus]